MIQIWLSKQDVCLVDHITDRAHNLVNSDVQL